MTKHNQPSDCVGDCVGTASETPLRASASDCVGPVPPPTGTDAVSEPQSLRRPTASERPICGHPNSPWICTIHGPHPADKHVFQTRADHMALELLRATS